MAGGEKTNLENEARPLPRTGEERALYIKEITGANKKAMELARKRQADLAKPPGSLGRLEDISIAVAGMTGKITGDITRPLLVVACADHGVVAEGVSSAPPSVTEAQTINILKRKTGVGALAKARGTDILVLDTGVRVDLPAHLVSKKMEDYKDHIVLRKVSYGTENLAKGPAMTEEQMGKAMASGMEAVRFAVEEGADLLGVGEMGIGNTTSSAIIAGALLGLSAEQVTGRGGGLLDRAFENKKRIIREVLQRIREHYGEKPGPENVLMEAGGLEIAAMTGCFLEAARCRIPVVVDGFISAAAALLAVSMAPAAKDYLIPSHKSEEIGYEKIMKALGLDPFLHLGMRLGEGSGCILAFDVVRASLAVMKNMATFEEASIDDEYLSEIRKGDCF